MLDLFEERAKLTGIEHRLRDRIFGSGLDLPLETPDLFLEIHRARIDADAYRKRGRLSDRIVADIQTVIELIYHVRQTDRVDVEHGGRVRVRAHLRGIAGDDQQIT